MCVWVLYFLKFFLSSTNKYLSLQKVLLIFLCPSLWRNLWLTAKSDALTLEFQSHSYPVSEKAMAPHSSTLAWKIPWMEEPGRLQSMGWQSQIWLSDFTFTFHFHALEKEMATHSSVLAWRIPGMAEPGGLLSMGSHRVRHDWSNLAGAAVAATILRACLNTCL